MEIEKIYNIILKVIPDKQVKKNVSMAKYTTFKIGGEADLLITINTIDELRFILKIIKEEDIPLTVIGKGSNVLVRDGGIRGIVVKLNFQKTVIKQEGTKVKVILGAGVPLGKFGMQCYKNSLSGFEFASGIPGTIGGAIRMNAGAHGREFKDLVYSTLFMDEYGSIHTLTNREHQFGYRHSWFKENFGIILETSIYLEKGNFEEIGKKMTEYKKFRKEKQPITMPSAGSTFKRGEDFITAQLIDKCGLKGYQIGGAKVSEKHAGFIVNAGNATANNVLDLIEHIKQQIKKTYDKQIELEIELMGEDK